MKEQNSSFNLQQLINYVYEGTVLPEMFDLLGEEAMQKLILVFGGLKVSIPSYKEIKDLKRNFDIFETLSHSDGHETIKLLASKYNITTSWVHIIFKKMKKEHSKILHSIQNNQNPELVRITTKRKIVSSSSNERQENGDQS